MTFYILFGERFWMFSILWGIIAPCYMEVSLCYFLYLEVKVIYIGVKLTKGGHCLFSSCQLGLICCLRFRTALHRILFHVKVLFGFAKRGPSWTWEGKNESEATNLVILWHSDSRTDTKVHSRPQIPDCLHPNDPNPTTKHNAVSSDLAACTVISTSYPATNQFQWPDIHGYLDFPTRSSLHSYSTSPGYCG